MQLRFEEWIQNGRRCGLSLAVLLSVAGWLCLPTATNAAPRDLGGDNKSDLILTNASGQIDGLQMNSLDIAARSPLFAANSGWRVTHTANLNGDGKSDLLWQHADGTINAWLMNGVTLTAGATIQSAGTSRSLPQVKSIARCDPAVSSICVLTPSPTSAIVHWQLGQSDAALGIVDFHIYRNNALRMVAEETSNRFRDTDLAPGTNNTYRVDALDANGNVVRSHTTCAVQPPGSSDLIDADLPPTSDATSRAFTTFGWTPNPLYDTCPKTLHDAHWTYGPDNKVYPTWHAPIYEFADGSKCTFGHEHGQDQRQSNLYTTAGAIPFGYVNEQLSPNDPNFQRNEDHVGHKVVFFNGIRDIITNPSGSGEINGTMLCDIYFKLHQGTHSPDALRNNSHERFLNYRCPNGLEIRYKSLQPFGAANTFLQGNAMGGTTLTSTAGSVPAPCVSHGQQNCQPGGADRRLIGSLGAFQGTISNYGGATDYQPPCDNCTGTIAYRAELASIGASNYYVSTWNNESWQGGPTYLFYSLQGRRIFQMTTGPYWNLHNPSRYYSPSGDPDPTHGSAYLIARQIDLCYQSGSLIYNSNDCKLARSRNGGAPIDYRSPLSPFKGTVRFNETNFVNLFNPDPVRERVFFDPYGQTSMEGDDGVNSYGELPLIRSTKYNIRGYFKSTGQTEISMKLGNFAGANQCGGSACFTDFSFYRLRNGTVVDARVHVPN
jgi:hypothetical protein